MKYTIMYKGLGFIANGIIKKDITDKKIRKAIKREYKDIIKRASDIGKNNRLFSSYGLCAYFIAMNRMDNLTPEENIKILEEGMRNSKIIKKFMGNANNYFNEKEMASRRKWSIETHKKKYKNDWVVDVIEKNDECQFGFNYLECGVCKLCKDEGCFEYAKYLCSLDFMLVELIGIGLKRTKTLAEGYDYCDFRFIKK